MRDLAHCSVDVLSRICGSFSCPLPVLVPLSSFGAIQTLFHMEGKLFGVADNTEDKRSKTLPKITSH